MAVRQGSTEHFDGVLREEQGFDNAVQASAKWLGLSGAEQMPRLRAGDTKLAVQIIRSNLDVAHGHPWIGVAE